MSTTPAGPASGSNSAQNPEVTLRQCRGVEEFARCVALQKEVWDFADADLIPVRMFVVAEKIGGQVLGAFAADNQVDKTKESLVGFALSIPGTRDGHPYLHSHMLAVREAYRNTGLGRRLKFLQREDAIARGFQLMEWTFDPLEIKNAHLNLERLGAIARRYSINQYGISSSPLQGGLPTDRLVAEWWLNSARAGAAANGTPRPAFETKKEIAVPALIYSWKSKPETRDRAQSVQLANREQFLAAFHSGLVVLGYQRDEEGNGRFLLGEPNERFAF
jgi:predicted GNAT superfamily acetyltransferase